MPNFSLRRLCKIEETSSTETAAQAQDRKIAIAQTLNLLLTASKRMKNIHVLFSTLFTAIKIMFEDSKNTKEVEKKLEEQMGQINKQLNTSRTLGPLFKNMLMVEKENCRSALEKLRRSQKEAESAIQVVETCQWINQVDSPQYKYMGHIGSFISSYLLWTISLWRALYNSENNTLSVHQLVQITDAVGLPYLTERTNGNTDLRKMYLQLQLMELHEPALLKRLQTLPFRLNETQINLCIRASVSLKDALKSDFESIFLWARLFYTGDLSKETLTIQNLDLWINKIDQAALHRFIEESTSSLKQQTTEQDMEFFMALILLPLSSEQAVPEAACSGPRR